MNIRIGYSMQLRNFINAGLIKRKDLTSAIYQTYVYTVDAFAADRSHTPEQVAEFAELYAKYTEAQMRQFVPNWTGSEFVQYVKELQSIPF